MGNGRFGAESVVEAMAEQHFEVIEHTADWAIRVTGSNLAQLFQHAAEGMSILMAGELELLPADEVRIVELTAYDSEGLLVEWLSELAYWAEMEQIVINQIDIKEISETRLAATVRGGKAPVLDKHIKAVTFHNLAIKSTDSGLEVTIVFDV